MKIAHSQFTNLFALYCSDFKVSYERKIRDSVSVESTRDIKANLIKLENLLNNIKGKASLEEFLLCADSTDLWPLKKKLIDAVSPDEDCLASTAKEVMLKQITYCKQLTLDKLGSVCLAEFRKKANTEEIRKEVLQTNLQKLLRKWLSNSGSIDELVNILFIKVYSDPFRNLLQEIMDCGRFKQLILLVNELFVSSLTVRNDSKAILSIESHSPFIFISEISRAIEGMLFDGFHTIKVFVPGTVVMDGDLTNDKYSGRNIVIVCETIQMSSGDRVIDVSGKAGQNAPADQAESGTSYIEIVEDGKSVKVGEKGKNGESGKNASVSGDVLISCSKVSGPGKLTVKTNGAKGGDGQDGGNGMKGDPGAEVLDAGADTSPYLLFTKNDTGFLKDVTLYYLYEGPSGGQGGKGGAAGNGGDAGLGSKEGSTYLLGGASSAIEISQKSGFHGQVGKAGEPGKKGEGKQGGHHCLQTTRDYHTRGYKQVHYHITTTKYFKDYFTETHDKESETIHPNNDEKNFDKAWDVVQANLGIIPVGVKDKVNDKYGKKGSPGSEGEKGSKGNIGGKTGDKIDLLFNPNNLIFNELIADYVIGLFKDQTHKEFILYKSGIFAPNTLTTSFLFKLFKKTEDEEKKLLNTEQEIKAIRLAKSIYEEAQKSFLNKTAAVEPDWQIIQFIMSQKLSYFNERLAGGGINGNQIVNLRILAKQLKVLLDDSEKTTIAERKEHYYKEFNNRINSNIASGFQQVCCLKDRIDTLMNKSSHNISHILEEISTMEEKEDKYANELIKRREALESEMENQLIFGVLSSVVSVVGTISGAGSVLSGISQNLNGVLSDKASTKISIDELQSKIQIDQKMIQANKDFIQQRFRPLPDMPYDIPLEMRKEVLSKLELKDLTSYKEESQKEMDSYLDKLKDWESKKLRWDLYLQSKEELSSDDFKLAEKGKKEIDDQIDELIKENEDLPQILFDFRKAEISALKNRQEIKNNREKLDKLEKHAKELDERKESYDNEKVTKSLTQIIGIGSSLYSGYTKYIDTKKEYGDKISVLNKAVESSKDKIAALVTMDNNVRAYQENTLNKTMAAYLNDEQNAFKNQDTFKLTVTQLDVKNELTSLIKEAKTKFGTIEKSFELMETLQGIEETLSTQITLFDKIQGQEEQRQMGELIFGLTSTANQWSTEQIEYLKFSRMLRLQYLAQLELNAYLLWSFPFGYAGINRSAKMNVSTSDTLEDAIKIVKAQNDAITDWLETELYSLLKNDVPTIYRNFIHDAAYATVDFTNRIDEAKCLLTGEKITLLLLPSKEFDVVKYITFYAYIPLYKDMSGGKFAPDKIMVDLKFNGATSFLVYDRNRKKEVTYQFNQDPVSIIHSLDVKIEDKQGCEAIWATEEDKVIRKFKNNNMDSGRSPYSQVTIQIFCNDWIKSFSSWSDISKKLQDRFETVFPSVMKSIDSKIESIIADLQNIEWISDSKQIVACWSKICTSNKLEDIGYSSQQSQWIKDVLFERSNILGESELTKFNIQFIGYGIFLNRMQYEVPEEYERFRVADTSAS